MNIYTFLTKKEHIQKLQNLHQLTTGDIESQTYLYNYTKRLKYKTNIEREKYLAAFNFDKALTKFREKAPKKAIYVFENQETHEPISFEMSLEDLVKISTYERIKDIPLGKLQKIKEVKQKENDDDIDKKHLIQARSAYIGTINRINEYYKNSKNGNSGVALLMWQVKKHWTIAKVLNKGDVKEAYVSALLSEHNKIDALCSTSSGKPEYYSHKLIESFFNNYISKVTNMSAIREEDVVAKGVQYAVKGSYAELPSLQQYITIATAIETAPVKPNNDFNIETLLEEKLP